MGTYYTELFEKGDISFEDFLWLRARLHGPLIHMRDEPYDAPIHLPRDSSPDNKSYYVKQLEATFIERVSLATSSLEEIQKKIDEDYQKSISHAKKKIAETQVVRARMEKMLERFQNWKSPTEEHVSLKLETVKSLQDGITSTDWYLKHYQETLNSVKPLAEIWKQQQLQMLDEDMERIQQKIKEELNNQDYVINWIQDLDQSVPAPQHLKAFPSRTKEGQ